MKVFVYSARQYEIPFLEKAAEGKHDLFFSEKKLSPDTASLARGCEAVALFTADDASAVVVRKLSSLGIKYIALRSAGYDHLDLKEAHKLGVKAGNVPAYSPYAIAEHAVALLLALNRRIVESQMLQSLHDFRLDTLTGFDVHGKTVGVIGTGTIGIAFAKIMKGFGAYVIACDPVQNKAVIESGVRYVSQSELLEASDIVSIHCPLTPQTKYMITGSELARMKKGAILINTARGGIVKTEDLLHSLENGHLGGACLDVYESEKSLFFEDRRKAVIQDATFARLRMHRNVIITGHQAFLTVEALSGIAATTIENLDYWEDGEAAPCELSLV